MDSHTQETVPKAEAIRICFRFKPQDIPGKPGARSITVANAFMEANFQRKFDWEKDYVYTPAGIDETTRKLFMFLDVNKHAHHTFQVLRCYNVAKGSPMTFETTQFNSVRNFSDLFPWGGRDMKQLEKAIVHPVCPEAQGVDGRVVE